ncbi:hypothetical protein [Roseovarius phycicola]|uniref:Uncharacterized protein n=1 Tax=Roseovarius phycicola TaxID=3080976 RepID=A0ABZ2HH31_9RHOB
MSELLKHYVPAFGALLTTSQPEPVYGLAGASHAPTTQVYREEIVELFKDKLR